MITWDKDMHPSIDGQRVDYYHTEEGRQARITACRIAHEDMGCFPPCGGDCCKRVREFMSSAEYVGRE